MTKMTDNILHIYATATEAEHAEGIDWYPSTQALAASLSSDLMLAAGVFAAYSPLTPWWRNVELATDSIRTGIARTDSLDNSVRAAQRILDGEPVQNVLKGLKTYAFARNIAGDHDYVTVDSHAYSIAIGAHTFSTKTKMNVRMYREIADAYRTAAGIVNESPATLQAITWVSWRNDNINKAARKNGL